MTKIVTPRHEVLAVLGQRNPAEMIGNVIVVRTDVLLASGDQCVVVVEGGAAGDRVTVSDAGGVLIALAEAGFELGDRGYERVRRAARKFDLHLENGVFRSRPYSLSEASQAVVLAANAMRDVLTMAFDIARGQEKLRFRERVEKQLAEIFEAASIQKRAMIRGHSEDQLTFDFQITLPMAGGRLLVDAPVPDPSSVAAVVLRHFDAKAAHIPGLRQAIIYDERDKWPSSSLAQLKLADVSVIGAHNLRAGLLFVMSDG